MLVSRAIAATPIGSLAWAKDRSIETAFATAPTNLVAGA
jgi:hypothetical protein